jgi:hypothetical protein
MPIKPRADLPEPPSSLEGLSDWQRKISGGPVFDLADVKAHVQGVGQDCFVLATRKAEENLLVTLRWLPKDLCGFFTCLDRHHYRGSEWVYGSEKAKIAYPADVYLMGYNRVRVQETPKVDPWNYLKFSFSLATNTIEIFSIHPEEGK